MSDSQPYFIVDAFTNCPFAGNPAAVVPLSTWPEDAWLQNVAMEMNLSETAFVVGDSGSYEHHAVAGLPTEPPQVGDRGHYELRWFTPQIEVDLCGHATLATAKVLAHLGQLPAGSAAAFSTRSGVLKANRDGNKFQLDFPVIPEEPAAPPPGLTESLGIQPRYVGQNRFDFLLEAESESIVQSLRPDFKALAAIECRGVIVTARSDNPVFDFVSRFFAPAAGIDEDPVTGSAHCCLASYWAPRLGKTRMSGFQASPRGGVVEVELTKDRVLLGGEAVLVAKGELLVNNQ